MDFEGREARIVPLGSAAHRMLDRGRAAEVTLRNTRFGRQENSAAMVRLNGTTADEL